MSQPSGFVPIPFRGVGKLLLAVGAIGLAILLVSKLIVELRLPAGTFVMSISSIVIGLYLIFVVPGEAEN